MIGDVLDYSSGWPTPADILAAGFRGVVRYVGTPGRSKNLTRQEATDMRLGGVPIGLVYEDTAGWMQGGYAAGRSAALAVLKDPALISSGGYIAPTIRGVFFACDEEVQSEAEMVAVMKCLDGAAATLGRSRTGVYGQFSVIERALIDGHANRGWQTRAWSGNKVSSRACLFQQIGYVYPGGVQADRNTVLKPDWGQSPYQGDNDVVTTAEMDAIAGKVVSALTADTAFALRVRAQIITALADPTHQYLQDELDPIEHQGEAVAQQVAEIKALVESLPAGGQQTPGTPTPVDPEALARLLDYDRLGAAVAAHIQLKAV